MFFDQNWKNNVTYIDKFSFSSDEFFCNYRIPLLLFKMSLLTVSARIIIAQKEEDTITMPVLPLLRMELENYKFWSLSYSSLSWAKFNTHYVGSYEDGSGNR